MYDCDKDVFYQPLNVVNATATLSHDGGHHDIEKINTSHFLISAGSKDSESGVEDLYAELVRIPHDLSPLTVNEVAQLLKNLHMDCYVTTFETEMTDGKLLKHFQDEDLHSLNMSSFHVKKMVKFINGW